MGNKQKILKILSIREPQAQINKKSDVISKRLGIIWSTWKKNKLISQKKEIECQASN